MITCETDQFVCVEVIAYASSHSQFIVIEEYCYTRNNCLRKYIPKEIFNMIQVHTINFMSFSSLSTMDYSPEMSANHHLCNWSNFVNLKATYNINRNLYSVDHQYRVRIHSRLSKCGSP